MQQIVSSSLTRKYQATIPVVVRSYLGLDKGDRVVFRIEDDRVVLEKRDSDKLMSLQQSQLQEWDSPEDDDLFEGLQ